MGFRAYNRKVNIIVHGSGRFNWLQEQLWIFLSKYGEIYGNNDDGVYSNYWEIPVETVKNAVNYLKENYKPEENAGLSDYSAKELIEIFEEWLKDASVEDNFKSNGYSANDFIYIDWF